MDKQFWVELYNNKCEIPDGHTLTELTRELFSYLGSTDPELRDEIGYTVYANWLKQERYSAAEVRAHVQELLANLEKGIGETESDSVFLRTFSILFLAEIVHNDNKHSFLEKADIQTIFEKGIAYLATEKDPRGFIHVKGWAHALAHTADLMMVLAKNHHLAAAELKQILDAVSGKMFRADRYMYIHGEDERLANAVTQVLHRSLLTMEELKTWALTFVGQDWKGAYMDESRNRAFQNTRNLLRSIYLALKSDEGELPRRGEVESIFFEVLKELKPW
jgi:hypothetical protein